MSGSDLLQWPTRLARKRIRVFCCIPGDPVSKQRPRLITNRKGGKPHVYTPKLTKQAQDFIGWHIKKAHRSLVKDDVNSFGVRLMFFTKTQQRRDIDNMTKLFFDACTGIVWGDDSQVHELICRVVRSDENPRTEVAIYRLPWMDKLNRAGKKEEL